MTAYLPGHPDLDWEPAECYCGDPFEAHTHGASACRWCSCDGYAERTEVAATHAALDQDDQLDGERSRTRDNLTAAIHLEQRRHRRRTGGAA